MFNIDIQKYANITHFLFLLLFFVKSINILQERIDILQFIAWILPLIIFYYFINKLIIRSYQWFCFLLLIYFLFSSLRVFGTIPYWLDIVELLCICVLFIHIMFGPKSIRNMN
ncbi:MAG: DUF2069 domain-containing protein [Gammaproteobacteria bacterium]